MNLKKPKRKISYSAIKTWIECPYRYKLSYREKLSSFTANEYTIFGNVIHDICEQIALENLTENFDKAFVEHYDKSLVLFLASKFFIEFYNNKKLTEQKLNTYPATLKHFKDNLYKTFNKKLLSEMRLQGQEISNLILPCLKEYFGDYEVLGCEDRIYTPLKQKGYVFTGFVDLILKTKKDNKIHIIDFKTTSWGWNLKKKTDPKITYQLTLYKNFLCNKYNWDKKDVETYFILLKRTAKEEKVELLRISSGNKKTSNALSLLSKVIKSDELNLFPKNRDSCKFCSFYKTEYCRW